MTSQPFPRGRKAMATCPVEFTATNPGFSTSMIFPLPRRIRKGRKGSWFSASLSSPEVIGPILAGFRASGSGAVLAGFRASGSGAAPSIQGAADSSRQVQHKRDSWHYVQGPKPAKPSGDFAIFHLPDLHANEADEQEHRSGRCCQVVRELLWRNGHAHPLQHRILLTLHIFAHRTHVGQGIDKHIAVELGLDLRRGAVFGEIQGVADDLLHLALHL
jgi:hypothetical protein